MRSSWVHDDNAALLTDLYQLTMLQSYWREGMREDAVFDLFVRRRAGRNYLVACGLDDALHYLENLHFTGDSLEYLRSLEQFSDEFANYLEGLRFTGDVFAVAEGTPIFPDEPILEVVAPIMEAQLAETFLLNQLSFQTMLASKAARVGRAAKGRTIADFAARRTHGTDAAMKNARAGYIAGVHATSNVLAGAVYGIPVTGTMAHSYIEAHDREMDAFRAFSKLYPETTLLVDTYDTLEGIRNVIELSKELGEEFRVAAVRLDSGDLEDLAKESREMLDEAGLESIRIFASSSLDEYAIAELLADGAPIDGFGVGTKMGTSSDHPRLDSAYKLCSYSGKGRMKLSSEKSNYPGKKQIFRQFEGGKARRDILAARDESMDGEPLLRQVMKDGKRTDAGRYSLENARNHCEEAVGQLPDRLMALDLVDPPYSVEISDVLQSRTEELRASLEERLKRRRAADA